MDKFLARYMGTRKTKFYYKGIPNYKAAEMKRAITYKEQVHASIVKMCRNRQKFRKNITFPNEDIEE